MQNQRNIVKCNRVNSDCLLHRPVVHAKKNVENNYTMKIIIRTYAQFTYLGE